MNKCQAKVKKTFSGMVWGTKKIWENCPNDAKGEGNFCEVHGCFDCSLKSAEDCLECEGIRLCLNCRTKRLFKKDKERKEWIEKEAKRRKLFDESRKTFEKVKEQERLKKEKEEAEKKRLAEELEERERERDKLKRLPD